MERHNIGIEIGTSKYSMGIFDYDKINLIQNSLGEEVEPSLISIKKNNILVGDSAFLDESSNYSNTINEIKRLIADGVLSSDEDITITIYIDEQLTATNGYYDLRDSIMEELRYGIVNFDYGVLHQSIFNATVTVNIEYCDSSKNYLIQASDILANRIWTSYAKNDPKLRRIENHTTFFLKNNSIII